MSSLLVDDDSMPTRRIATLQVAQGRVSPPPSPGPNTNCPAICIAHRSTLVPSQLSAFRPFPQWVNQKNMCNYNELNENIEPMTLDPPYEQVRNFAAPEPLKAHG
jgi:hypothetical protein